MSKDPKLNSLDRFRKQSNRLVLESHPVGCGGIILRWRDPFATIPLAFHLYTPNSATCFLDGKELHAMRLDVAPGPHVFSLSMNLTPPSVPLVMFAASRFPAEPARTGSPAYYSEFRSVKRSIGIQAPKLASAADKSWKFLCASPEGDAWKTLNFDDSAWGVLVQVPTPKAEQYSAGAYQLSVLNKLKARCLGTQAPTGGQVWIRKRFEVAPASTK